jgi:hypothetical protein
LCNLKRQYDNAFIFSIKFKVNILTFKVAQQMIAKAQPSAGRAPALGWAFAIICCATLNVNIFTLNFIEKINALS